MTKSAGNATAVVEIEKLASLVTRAANKLTAATSAADVLDAMTDARAGYDIAKTAARLARAKDARDEVLAKCRQTMGDLLVIEAQAQCRIANEYDAAQERGEVATRADGTAIRDHVPGEHKVATVRCWSNSENGVRRPAGSRCRARASGHRPRDC
jgi:hypothetical protein